MNVIYNVFIKPVLVRVFGKPMKIAYHGNFDKPKQVHQPDKKKTEWIQAIPLIEVCEDEDNE